MSLRTPEGRNRHGPESSVQRSRQPAGHHRSHRVATHQKSRSDGRSARTDAHARTGRADPRTHGRRRRRSGCQDRPCQDLRRARRPHQAHPRAAPFTHQQAGSPHPQPQQGRRTPPEQHVGDPALLPDGRIPHLLRGRLGVQSPRSRRWVRGFSYITYYDSWEGTHPRVFTPADKPYIEFQSGEEINNWLLTNHEVRAHIEHRTPAGVHPKIVMVFFNEETSTSARNSATS